MSVGSVCSCVVLMVMAGFRLLVVVGSALEARADWSIVVDAAVGCLRTPACSVIALSPKW
ncbi:hypothetical protein [Escherichia coli]|uniref:hypothetical protein n=1 Tax=Escherichia coli TaxID=562 RepID=UPI00111588BC|nr:hypothetical protein [Escherichia coli]